MPLSPFLKQALHCSKYEINGQTLIQLSTALGKGLTTELYPFLFPLLRSISDVLRHWVNKPNATTITILEQLGDMPSYTVTYMKLMVKH